jgi:hypothetical protein
MGHAVTVTILFAGEGVEMMDIAFLLRRFSEMNESDIVVLRDAKGEPQLEAAGMLGKLRQNPEEAGRLVSFLTEAVSQASGAAAADDFEKEVRSQDRQPTAGYWRNVLRRYALNASASAALKKFVEETPENVLAALKFEELLPHCQAAVMNGVRKGIELMRDLSALPELDGGLLKPGVSCVPLETVQKAQKILAKASRDFFAALAGDLPEHSREQDLPLIKKAVFNLLLHGHAQSAESLLDALCAGPSGDIFAVQGAVVKSFTNFAKGADLPSGIDGEGPDQALRALREFVFMAACRRIKKRDGSPDAQAVRAEAASLAQPDALTAMARLQTLFLNALLRDLPAEKELRPRANVKGFDAEGLHADFVRDCIAKRYSFTIEFQGKVDNLLEREAAVGQGKKDLEFYEQQLKKMIDSGQEKEVKKWAPPQVRSSASMTEKDLKAAQEFIARGIPERDMRMAATALANTGSLKLFEAFFGKDPAAGVSFEVADRQMNIVFVPRKSEFSIRAELHNSRMQSVDRHGEGDDFVEFDWVNFFQMEYSGRLKREKDASHPSGNRWTVQALEVNLLASHLMPPAKQPPAQ